MVDAIDVSVDNDFVLMSLTMILLLLLPLLMMINVLCAWVCVCVLQGLLYACSIQQLVSTTMNLHVSLQKPMTKASVLAMCRLIELLKAIEDSFHRRTMLLAESMNHIVQNVSHKALMILKTVRVSARLLGQHTECDIMPWNFSSCCVVARCILPNDVDLHNRHAWPW